MHKAIVMNTKNELAAIRDKMRNMTHAAVSIEKKVMVGEAEVRRHCLLTSSSGTNRSKRIPLFPKLEATGTLLLDDEKIQGFGLKKISIT